MVTTATAGGAPRQGGFGGVGVRDVCCALRVEGPIGVVGRVVRRNTGPGGRGAGRGWVMRVLVCV